MSSKRSAGMFARSLKARWKRRRLKDLASKKKADDPEAHRASKPPYLLGLAGNVSIGHDCAQYYVGVNSFDNINHTHYLSPRNVIVCLDIC
jgi:hypothetical protein